MAALKVTEVRLVQPTKALLLIEVTDLPMVTEVKLVHPPKIPKPI